MINIKYVVFIGVIASISITAFSNNTTPSALANMQVNSDHPLSTEELNNDDTKMSMPMYFTNFNYNVRLAGAMTYTYVRCYYKYNPNNPAQTATTYEWARKSDGNYYKLNGAWRSDGKFSWENMFYTDTQLSDIQSICDKTLSNANINAKTFYFVAADNQLSFNQTIWQNDDKNEANRNYITKIIAFGDSLTDINNMYNASFWKLPNSRPSSSQKSSYFQGRFSNGYTWVEYLAQEYNLPIYNWAIGGATGDTSNYGILPGLKQEVNSWNYYMSSAPNYKPSNTLFTILIGANDFMSGGRTVEEVISDVREAIQNIYSHGGTNILLLNLPDVSLAPVFNTVSGIRQANRAKVSQQVVEYNQKLLDLSHDLTKMDTLINLQVFDTYQVFNDIVYNHLNYGITEVNYSCLDINTDSNKNFMLDHLLRNNCNPDTYVFWDIMHPTTRVHKILGDKIADFIRDKYPIS